MSTCWYEQQAYAAFIVIYDISFTRKIKEALVDVCVAMSGEQWQTVHTVVSILRTPPGKRSITHCQIPDSIIWAMHPPLYIISSWAFRALNQKHWRGLQDILVLLHPRHVPVSPMLLQMSRHWWRFVKMGILQGSICSNVTTLALTPFMGTAQNRCLILASKHWLKLVATYPRFFLYSPYRLARFLSRQELRFPRW